MEPASAAHVRMVEQAALDHVTRCWAAEETNAERVAQRKTLIVGLPAGFLAVVGLNADQVVALLRVALRSTPPAARAAEWGADLATCGAIFLGAGLLFLFISASHALGVGLRASEREGLAISHLLPSACVPALVAANEREGRDIAFELSIEGVNTLHRLNSQVETRLALACEWLVAGLALCFSALVIYAGVVP